MTETHYQVLGVAPTATPAEIKSAYRNLAMIVHPDLGGPAMLFERVSVAHEVLTDPARRHSYDLFLSEGGTDPRDFHRRERYWHQRAQRQPTSPATARMATAQPTTDPGAPPRPPRRDASTPEHQRRDHASGPDTLAPQAALTRAVVRGATLSTLGFWLVQILWLVIDDDLDDISDAWDLSSTTWAIVVLALANLALALRLRTQLRLAESTATSVLATIACSGSLILIFVLHGMRTDDPGVWPAAIGAAISGVSAVLLGRHRCQ